MKHPSFMIDLLNVLKNKRRMQTLKLTSKERYSLSRIQQELRKLGYYHSKRTITEEYINPLIKTGLLDETQGQYYSTAFGRKLNDLVKDFDDFESILSPHSKCHEEAVLAMLLNGSKTNENLKDVIPAKSVARVLSRLQKTQLIETSKKNDYVFYFRTKRDPKKARFSLTEQKVYESIPLEGISARKLAEKAKISLRRTYKYLRRLKGKKMVFARTNPKAYALTPKGVQTSTTLQKIRSLVTETLDVATQLVKDKEIQEQTMPSAPQNFQLKQEKKEKVAPITIIENPHR